jgi:hypothetical protein
MDAQSTLAKPSEPTDTLPTGSALTRRRQALVQRGLQGDLLPVVVLVAASVFAFRYLLYGYRFIGNSDRWNQYVLFAQFHADTLATGSFTTWSQNLLAGFDIVAQPFGFFTPLFLIAPLLHTSDVVAIFGYVDLALLAATLLITYWVVLQFTHDRLASIAGAFIYSCSTVALLKLSQADLTYLSILVAPILFYIVHSATREHRLRTVGLITAITAFCLYSAFLQEFSYVVLFLVLYAGWRALHGNVEGLFGLMAGLMAGSAIAVPRLVAEYQTLSDSLRATAAMSPDYGFVTLLRYFSRDIYGRSFAESRTGNWLNLYEGDLLFSTVFASLLFVGILLDRGRRATTPWGGLRLGDIQFWLAYILLVFAVMHVEAVYHLFSLLYVNLPFQHGRLGVSALLPISLLSALYLRRREHRRLGWRSWSAIVIALAVIAGATTFDYETWRNPILGALGLPAHPFIDCTGCLEWLGVQQFLAVDVIRFSALAVLFLILVMSQKVLPWLNADAVRMALALGIVFQAIWSANVWLSGPDTRDQASPFIGNNIVLASPNQFLHPTPGEVQQLKSKLDNDTYRSISICPQEIIEVDCSNSLGLGWNLRLLDGYVSGLPVRLASLPWAPNIPTRGVETADNVHQLRFRSKESVPWRLMSLLNVRDAIVVTPALFTNADARLPDDLEIVHNPSSYIYPRAYFAHLVESVSETDDIAKIQAYFGACRDCNNALSAPKAVDEVEGPVMGTFDDSGTVEVAGGGDRLEATFPPSTQQRFLVLDELYARGWSAYAGGQELAVYPTNVVLRGVVVPAGVGQVTFEYHSFLTFAGWYSLALLVVAGLAAAAFRFGERLTGLFGGG